MGNLRINTGFSNNLIFIIDGLRLSDLQTAQKLYENLLDLKAAYSEEFPHIEYTKINNRDQFFIVLERVYNLCKKGGKPIIHLEVHGNKDCGISIGDS